MRSIASLVLGLVALGVVGGLVPRGALPYGRTDPGVASLIVDGAVTKRLPLVVADGHLERVRGLGGRRLAEGWGMLLRYDPPRPVRLTFARTCQTLDVAFVDRTGTVLATHRGIRVGDPRPLPSPGPVRSVLELRAGDLDRLGFAVGAAVTVERAAQDLRRRTPSSSPLEPCSR